MPTGTLDIKLRPLKLAFFVEPGDPKGLLDAIEINTFLWCGTFNPIIPVFNRTPKAWRDRFHNVSAKSVAEGMIQAFDPDFIVLSGTYSQLTIGVGHPKVLQSADILQSIESDGTPRYGIGLYELLEYFIDTKLKFVRREPLSVVLPDIGKKPPLFLAAVFGSLPPALDQAFRDDYEPVLQGKRTRCSLTDYADFLKPDNLFLRRLNSLYVRPIRSDSWLHGNCVFYLDASDPLDVIDYWNLRALGWSVVPVARQAADSAPLKDHVRTFIEQNFYPLRGNPSIFSHTTLLKARSVSEDELMQFGQSLVITPPTQPGAFKFSMQRWYPRIWDEWARDKDGADCAELEARLRSIDLPGDERIDFKTLDPQFAFRYTANTEVRFGNAVDFRLYGSTDLMAEVMPEGDENLVRAIGGLDPEDWRFTRNGPVYLAQHHLSLPRAEDVFTAWLRSKGWSAKLSASGLIARQMIKQLGHGAWGISLLAREEIIHLLNDMSDGKTVGADELWGRIQKIANTAKYPGNPAGLLRRLTDTQMFRLGLEVQCPICTQRSWFSMKDVDYEVQCQKCLERFSIPSHLEEPTASMQCFSLCASSRNSCASRRRRY